MKTVKIRRMDDVVQKYHVGSDGMKIDTSRVVKKIKYEERKLNEMKRFHKRALDSAKRYGEIIKKICSRRGIKIVGTNYYFTRAERTDYSDMQILCKFEFAKKYGEYGGVKVRNLERALREAGIPSPVGAQWEHQIVI